jgi:serine/threonine protein kinase
MLFYFSLVSRYADVYSCETSTGIMAIKSIDLPLHIQDHNIIVDIYNEITIMQLCTSVIPLIDYGVTKQHYLLLMPKYTMNLRNWRQQRIPNWKTDIQEFHLYLHIYSLILQRISLLHQSNIIHFDLKCENILLNISGDIQNSYVEPSELVLAGK